MRVARPGGEHGFDRVDLDHLGDTLRRILKCPPFARRMRIGETQESHALRRHAENTRGGAQFGLANLAQARRRIGR